MLNPYVIHKPPPSEINAPVYKPNYSQDTKTVNTCCFIVHFEVTIECGLFLLTRVFTGSVFCNLKIKHYTLYEEPSILIVEKILYKINIMSSSHGLSVLTVKCLQHCIHVSAGLTCIISIYSNGHGEHLNLHDTKLCHQKIKDVAVSNFLLKSELLFINMQVQQVS